jgi:hypothetical protein
VKTYRVLNSGCMGFVQRISPQSNPKMPEEIIQDDLEPADIINKRIRPKNFRKLDNLIDYKMRIFDMINTRKEDFNKHEKMIQCQHNKNSTLSIIMKADKKEK